MTKVQTEPIRASALGLPGGAPIAVEVTRGPIVESRHAVDAAVVDQGGELVAAWGEVERPIYPRSALKPIQALPLIETGAADAFGLDACEIALACASHAGEPVHVEAVRSWLVRLGLGENDLECGAHPPRHAEHVAELVRAGRQPGPAHNNCSGKHAGMLSHAVHLAEPTVDYVATEHPAQRRVGAAIAALCDVDLTKAPAGVDGCSIPTYAIPLKALALGLARLANPEALAPARAAACRRIARAMWDEAYMVSGRASGATAMLETGAGRLLVKGGAEGVYVAGLAGRGLGVALKVRDGAGRAAEVALLALLEHLDALDAAAFEALIRFAAPPVKNVRGAVVGALRAAPWRPWSGF